MTLVWLSIAATVAKLAVVALGAHAAGALARN